MNRDEFRSTIWSWSSSLIHCVLFSLFYQGSPIVPGGLGSKHLIGSLYSCSHVLKYQWVALLWKFCTKRLWSGGQNFCAVHDLNDPVNNRMLAIVTLWWKKSSNFLLSHWASSLKFIARGGLRTRSWIVSNFTLRYHGKNLPFTSVVFCSRFRHETRGERNLFCPLIIEDVPSVRSRTSFSASLCFSRYVMLSASFDVVVGGVHPCGTPVGAPQ